MNALKAILVKVVLRLCSLLPLEWARALGRGAGRIHWLLGSRSCKVTRRNLELAFPHLSAEQQGHLARRSLCATGELLAEMGHVWLRPLAHVMSLIKAVHGASLISDAQASGRGVVVLSPHLGNWEVVGLHLATLGRTVSLFEPPKLAGLGSVIERARQRSGAQLVPTTSGGLARLLKNVRQGGVSALLPDQIPAELGSGENALFMGVPCFTGTLASNLIRRTGALAVFGYAERVRGGFIVRYELADAAIYSEDTALSLAALNCGVEACLVRCAEQYQWEYKRFRVRPRQGPRLYDDL
jgi:KDO2-lipid IV(A) lauroyltransferase